MKYVMNTEINPREKVIFSCLEDYEIILYAFLIQAIILQSSPGRDLIRNKTKDLKPMPNCHLDICKQLF